MSTTLAAQLYAAGLAPEMVTKAPIITDDGKGGASTGQHVYYLSLHRWEPDANWDQVAYYIEGYGISIEIRDMNRRTPLLPVVRRNMQEYEIASSIADIPAAICRLVLQLHVQGTLAPLPASG